MGSFTVDQVEEFCLCNVREFEVFLYFFQMPLAISLTYVSLDWIFVVLLLGC